MGYRLRLPRGFYPWSSVRSGAIARDRDRVGHRLDLPMRPPPRECVRETAIEQLGERKRAFRLLILVGQPATEREGGDRLAGIECRGLNTDHRFIPPSFTDNTAVRGLGSARADQPMHFNIDTAIDR